MSALPHLAGFAQARRNMVDGQLRTFEVMDRAVLAAMDEVPRELFVPPSCRDLAYSDLPIALDGAGASGTTMLAPMVLARLIQALEIEAGAAILDVAGGLGYSAAILARLGARVTALGCADGAAERLAEAGLADRVTLLSGPLDRGAPGDGPFAAILVNGAVAVRPDALLAQLDSTGRLACLSGDKGRCRAALFVRSGDAFGMRALFDAAAPVLPGFAAASVFEF